MNQIRLVLLIGCATWEIWFNQLEISRDEMQQKYNQNYKDLDQCLEDVGDNKGT